MLIQNMSLPDYLGAHNELAEHWLLKKKMELNEKVKKRSLCRSTLRILTRPRWEGSFDVISFTRLRMVRRGPSGSGRGREMPSPGRGPPVGAGGDAGMGAARGLVTRHSPSPALPPICGAGVTRSASRMTAQSRGYS